MSRNSSSSRRFFLSGRAGVYLLWVLLVLVLVSGGVSMSSGLRREANAQRLLNEFILPWHAIFSVQLRQGALAAERDDFLATWSLADEPAAAVALHSCEESQVLPDDSAHRGDGTEPATAAPTPMNMAGRVS